VLGTREPDDRLTRGQLPGFIVELDEETVAVLEAGTGNWPPRPGPGRPSPCWKAAHRGGVAWDNSREPGTIVLPAGRPDETTRAASGLPVLAAGDMHGRQLVACRGMAWQHRPAPAAPVTAARTGAGTTPAGSRALAALLPAVQLPQLITVRGSMTTKNA
jgi:hypothetical protein